MFGRNRVSSFTLPNLDVKEWRWWHKLEIVNADCITTDLLDRWIKTDRPDPLQNITLTPGGKGTKK
jgi:hypothetical protein